MKKLICIALTLIMALSLAACGGNEAADAQTGKLSGTVSTDGSTSMEKVVGGLGEMFMELNNGVTFTYTPPVPVPVSRLFRKAAATSVWLHVI